MALENKNFKGNTVSKALKIGIYDMKQTGMALSAAFCSRADGDRGLSAPQVDVYSMTTYHGR